MKTILLIEDNAMCAGNIARALTKTYSVLTASTGNDAFGILAKNEVNLILLDYYLPDISGIAVLRRLASEKNTVPVIMITEETDPEKAVECIKKGALDYVPKNKFFKDPSILLNKVGLILQEREYEARNRAYTEQMNYLNRNNFVPDIPEYRSLYKHAEQALKGNLSLLIYGESGVGKGMLVSSIHQKLFPDKPLITIDCGAIPSSLIEAELFGHQKGAFTGATSDKPGKIELANHGILFLDEIANASHDVQMKLLRVIQEKKVCRIGARKETHVDFMLISATNKDLPTEIEKDTFMEDLYYRIKQVDADSCLIRPPILD